MAHQRSQKRRQTHIHLFRAWEPSLRHQRRRPRRQRRDHLPPRLRHRRHDQRRRPKRPIQQRTSRRQPRRSTRQLPRRHRHPRTQRKPRTHSKIHRATTRSSLLPRSQPTDTNPRHHETHNKRNRPHKDEPRPMGSLPRLPVQLRSKPRRNHQRSIHLQLLQSTQKSRRHHPTRNPRRIGSSIHREPRLQPDPKTRSHMAINTGTSLHITPPFFIYK